MTDLFMVMFEMKAFGAIGMITTLFIVGWGLPHQALRLWREKSAKSLSLHYFLLQKVSVVCFFFHGYFEVDSIYIWVPQVLGFTFGTLIVGQIIYYDYFYKPSETDPPLPLASKVVQT